MRKGICPKCNKLISVDENVNPFNCPMCNEAIPPLEAIKLYNRSVNALKRKAEISFMGSTDYQKAYENYSKLLDLANNVLTVLTGTSLARLYCTNLHNIYIKEATDILIKGSDKVTIDEENVKILSEFLKKFRLDCQLIINSFDRHKLESKYALNLYRKALEETLYYLDNYLNIYNSLDKLNVYFVEGKDVIEEQIKNIKERLEKDKKANNEGESKHDFYDEEKKVINDIFPNKKKLFRMRMVIYGLMTVGFICALVGLILISTMPDNRIPSGILAALGAIFFVGGYFLNHYLRGKNYGTDY